MTRGRAMPGRARTAHTRPGRSVPGPPLPWRRAWPAARSARGTGTRAAASQDRAGRGDAGPEDRFGLLLVVLVITYLLSAFTSGVWVSALQIVLVVTVAVLAVRTGHMARRTAQASVTVAVGGSVATVTLALVYSADVGIGLASVWTALVLLFAAVLIVRRVLSHSVVTLQSIFGALSAYMILGLMFAAVFGAMNRFGGTFFAGGEPANLNTLQYFSFTTLTTLGYGDFTAADSGGRAVAVMEALVGQVFLATLVARLVAAFGGTGGRPRRRAPRARPRPPARARPRTPGRPQALPPGPAHGSAGRAEPTASHAHGRRAGR